MASAVHDGVRRGELMGLQWKDVDLTAGTLAVRRSVNIITGVETKRVFQVGAPENGRARNVALDAKTVAVLKAYRRELSESGVALITGDTHLFGDLASGHRDPNNVTEAFARHVGFAAQQKGADLPWIRIHVARHSHATALLLAGVPVQVAAEGIGDDPGLMPRAYAHALPGQQRAAAEAVASPLGG